MTSPAKRRPTFLQAFAITCCGALMFFFGCLGALTGMEGPPHAVIPTLGIAGLYIGGTAFAIGLLLLIFVIVRSIVEAVNGAWSGKNEADDRSDG